jgi:glycosyltransferase involved in cell wall biosynthesis
MNILMVVFNQVEHGTYFRAFQLARFLQRRGHQVTLIATSQNRRLQIVERVEEGVLIVESPDLLSGPLRSGWDIWNAVRRILWLRGRSFDLVHAFESRPVVILPVLTIHRGRTLLFMDWADWFGRGGSVEERPNPLMRAILRPIETYFEDHFRNQADGTTVISRTLHNRALALGIPPDRILDLPNGSAPEDQLTITKEEARSLLDIQEDLHLIGYVGRIFKRDAELMAQAFDLLYSHDPQYRLIIAGYCPYDVRQLSRHADAIFQTGPLPSQKLDTWLSACDLFWLPFKDSNANRGRFPLKLNYYMSIGRPTMATSVGDLEDVFNHHKIGRLASDQPEALAQMTRELFSRPDLCDSMGTTARSLAENEFHWDHITQTLIDFYEQIRQVVDARNE